MNSTLVDMFGLDSAELSQLQQEILRNWTNTKAHWQFDLLKMPLVRYVIVTVYVIVIFTGIFSNTVAIYIAAKAKKPQTVTNIFVINLALSDLALCVFSLPVQLHYQLTDRWVFGEVLCRLVFSAFALPMYLSTVTILLIAVDRYWLIIYPLSNRISRRLACLLIAINVVVSVTMSVPVMHFTSLYVIDEPLLGMHKNLCVERWPSVVDRQVYSVFSFVVQFCLPLSLTTALYFRIYTRLRQRFRSTQNRPNQRRTRKTNKILVSIVVNFVVCWLPWNLFSLITELDHTLVTGPHFKLVDLSLKCFSMGSACVNPLLYCWLNDNLRKDLGLIAVKLKIYNRSATEASGPLWPDLPLFDVQPPSALDERCPCQATENVQTFSVSVDKFSSTRHFGH